jgi:folate-dependent phosphoribosylglycinamide formyltransferase PurN
MAGNKERLAILISGGGTTMAEMIKATQSEPQLRKRIEIAAVISSRSDAYGIGKAVALGVPAKDIVVVDPRDYRGRDGKKDQGLFGEKLAEEFRRREVTVFTQNGWLPQTPSIVVENWDGYNQHPGDPRDFGQVYGRQVHASALRFSDQVDRGVPTFAVAHRVTTEIDGGDIVGYESIMMQKPSFEERADYEGSISHRVLYLQQEVLPAEHRVQIRLLRRIAEGSVPTVHMPRVVFSGEERIVASSKQLGAADFPKG